MTGRIVSMTLSGANASDFTITEPTTLPANVSTDGKLIIIRFNSMVFGIRTAQLRITTVQDDGTPIPDAIVVNLMGRRGRSAFDLFSQVFDFGTVASNTPATATFPWMRNTGTEPLEWRINFTADPNFTILNTRPMPRLVTEPGGLPYLLVTLPPNDTLWLTARFNGAVAGQTIRGFQYSPINLGCGFRQIFEFTAQTVQNPPNITARNIVQGVETPIRSTRLYLGDFICPGRDAPFKDTTLKIYNSGQVTLNVTGATFNHPDFQIISPANLSPQNPLAVTFNTSRELTVRYTPRLTSILDFDTVAMTLFSNAANAPTGQIAGSTTVNFRVRNDAVRITVSKQLLDFGSVVRGTTAPAQTFTIRNNGTTPQPILPISSANFLVTIPTTILQPDEETTVSVRPVNTSTAGVFRETWRIADLCGVETPITVQITVNRPNPTIGLAVPVSFGRLVCETENIITQSIANTGNDANDLVITDLRIVGISNGAFSLVQAPALPLSIPSGQSRTVQIRFRPNRTGAITDTLRIVSNAGGTPTFNAALNGAKDSVSFRLSRTAVNFVNILPNAAAQDVITVFNTGTVPIRWGATSFSIASPFSLQFDPPETPVGGSSQVRVNFLGSAVDASATGTLTDTCGRAQTISVSATILRPYIAATPSVSFGTLVCETSSNGQISITNTGGQDLVVSAITPSSTLFSVQAPMLPLRLARNASAAIPVVFRPLPTTQGAANATITITSNAANGSSTTTTLSAVKNVLDFEFVRRFSSDLPNIVSRSLGDVPPNTPVSDTLSLRNTGNLPITWQAPFYSPDSLFIIESVSPNPTPPRATAVMRVRYVGSACPDSKITPNGIEVLSNYGFDCNKQPARVTLSARTLPATARLWTDSISAGISDTTSLPIRLRNPQYLREAGVTGFRFVLRYDFSTLVPLAADKGTIVGSSRLQPVTLMLPSPIPADSILGRVAFQATLGSTSGTLITIENLEALGSTGASCIIFDSAGVRGKFILQRICLEGGMRLVTAATTRTTLAQNKPNPASDVTTIDFSLLERGLTTITVYSIMGEAVLQAMTDRLEPGAYSLDLEVNRLPSGVYFYVLQTPTDRKTRRMEVIR